MHMQMVLAGIFCMVSLESSFLKTLGRCPKPRKLLKKLDQNLLGMRFRAFLGIIAVLVHIYYGVTDMVLCGYNFI